MLMNIYTTLQEMRNRMNSQNEEMRNIMNSQNEEIRNMNDSIKKYENSEQKIENSMHAKLENRVQKIQNSMQEFGKGIRNDINATNDIIQGRINRMQKSDSIQGEQQRGFEKPQNSNSLQDTMEADQKRNNVMVESSSPNKLIMLESELGNKAE